MASSSIETSDSITQLNYNHGHNILKPFDVSPNFLFTTSETKPDY